MSAASTGITQGGEALLPEHYSDEYEPPVWSWRPPPLWALAVGSGLLLAIGGIVWYRRNK